MSVERRRSNRKSTPITSVPAPLQLSAPFGPPLLLPGEDAAAYDALLARICAAVKPVDIIEEIFVNRCGVPGVGGLAVAPFEIESAQ